MGQKEIYQILGKQKGNLSESLLCGRAVGGNENEADKEEDQTTWGFLRFVQHERIFL